MALIRLYFTLLHKLIIILRYVDSTIKIFLVKVCFVEMFPPSTSGEELANLDRDFLFENYNFQFQRNISKFKEEGILR